MSRHLALVLASIALLCEPVSAGPPDPWIEADELLGRGKLEMAADGESGMPAALLEHLRAGPSPQRVVREFFERARSLHEAGDDAGAAGVLDERRPAEGSILAVRWWLLRFRCLSRLERWDDAARAGRAFEEAARSVGWLEAVDEALRLSEALFRSRFRYAELAALYARRAALEKARGNEESRLIAAVNRAGALLELGRARSAIEILTSLQPAARETGDAHLEVGILQGLGDANHRIGDYGAALLAIDRAGEILAGRDQPDRLAHNHTLRGAVLEEIGEFDRARSAYETALKLLGEGATLSHADLLGNLGNLAWRRGDSEVALRHLAEARGIFERLTDGLRVATTCRGTAETLTSMERYEEALGYLERAAKGFADHPVQLAETHAHVAQVRLEMGDRNAAHEALDAALALGVTEQDLNTHGWIHELRGRLLLEEGRPEDAGIAFRRAIDVLRGVVAGLGDEETFRAREQRSRLFGLATTAAFEVGDPAQALDALERGRAAALVDAMGSRRALREAAVPPRLLKQLRRAEEEAGVTFRRYRAVRARSTVIADSTPMRKEHEAALAALRAIEARVEREAKRLVELEPTRPLDLNATRRLLRSDEALVYYAPGGRDGHALVVRPTGARIVPLGPVAGIRLAAEAALGPLSDKRGTVAAAMACIDDLRRRLIAPLGLEDDVRVVYVCPDASVSYLPWTALLSPRESACVPSASALGIVVRQRRHTGKGVLALGDPDYRLRGRASSVRAVDRGLHLRRIPESRAEVEAIIGLVADAPNVSRLGAGASETALRRHVGREQRWRSIHLACHGIVNRRRPRLSALALTSDDEHDGLLTPPEILGLDLRCDAVVLSACETGRDRYVAAEGVAGLLRAFMAAGAPRVVVSLWKADDAATSALMVEFYRRWLVEGTAPAAALRMAQAAIAARPAWRHPRYWAAWVLWGLPE